MEKQDVLNWLNKRIKNPVHIDNDDVIFIRNYIHHYKKELVGSDRIVNSIQSIHPGEAMHYVDSMITILINDWNIQTKIEKRRIQDININISTGHHPFAKQDLDFITEYS